MIETAYATDEDIALRASADFSLLCPRDQKVAAGLDGSFDPSDRWTLRSNSVDFQAQAVMPGHVVQLIAPVATFRPPGESLIVASVSGHYLTLRRKGQALGTGQPPSPTSGLVGVEFLVATLAPQIQVAIVDIKNRFGINDSIPGRCYTDLRDPGSLCDVVVLTVLQRQYRDMSREASGSSTDSLAAKAQSIKAELDDLLARTVVVWRSSADVLGDSTGLPFSARISR